MSKTTITIPCSQCMTDLTVDLRQGTVTYKKPARGRGRLRVELQVLTSDLVDEGALFTWEAPCCEDYVDSLEKSEVGL